jgi:hypothetical protein
MPTVRKNVATVSQFVHCKKKFYFTVEQPIVLCSVAKGPKFSAAKHKRGKKMVWGRESLGPDFWQNYKKGPKRGRTFF